MLWDNSLIYDTSFSSPKTRRRKKALCVPYMVMLPLFWGWMSSTDSICWLKVQPVGLKATSWSYWREKRARWSCSFWKEKGKREGKKGHLKRAALSGVFLPQHGPGGVRTICVTVSLSRRNLCIFSIPDYFTNKLYCARVFLTQISNIYKYNNLITVLLISAKPVILWRRYQVLSMLYLSQPLCFLVFFSKSHQKRSCFPPVFV